MKNSLTYITRGCPRNCEYCDLRDAIGVGKELNTEEWKKAFAILKEMGIDFNLILGNETWLLRDRLLDIMKSNEVPYALYTTCPEPLFSTHKDKFFGSGVIDNLSCGIDYPPPYTKNTSLDDDSWLKSKDAWKGFTWIKEHFPDVDTQGTVTVHKGNYTHLPQLVQQLSEIGVFIGINFIHWNSDGKFDFFPSKEEIKDLLFEEEDLPKLREILDWVLEQKSLLQNPEFIKEDVKMLTGMGWHCQGDPIGGPTIDSDGRLRVCGYRKGIETQKFTIFDLPEKEEEWKEAVYTDAMECPGCSWSYPWMFKYWQENDKEMGKNVFVKHGGNAIDKDKWSKRNIEE